MFTFLILHHAILHFLLCLDLKNIHRILKRNQTKLRRVKERSAGGLERGGGR